MSSLLIKIDPVKVPRDEREPLIDALYSNTSDDRSQINDILARPLFRAGRFSLAERFTRTGYWYWVYGACCIYMRTAVGWFPATGDKVEDDWSIRLERQGKGSTSSER